MNKLSKTSKERLGTCHPDLILIIETAITISNIDFGVAEGYWPLSLQKKYFDEGKSKIDGINKKGKHNVVPSMAVDIYAYFNGKAQWDKESLSYISGVIHAVTEMLLKEDKISHRIRWGGNWDMDGVILIDQSFDDRPHYELIKAQSWVIK